MGWGLVSEMGHTAIETTDLAAAISDAETLLGLTVAKSEDGVVMLGASRNAHGLAYIEAESPGVHSLGFVARDGSALREIRARVDAENLIVRPRNFRQIADEDGFSFVGPEGWTFQIYLKPERTAGEAHSFGPSRYGHINLHPADPTSMMEFLRRVLDFRLSDVIGNGDGYFMRCNSDHHGVALLRGQGIFHHHAWETKSVADLVGLADRLSAAGRDVIWGPVRHGAGHNIAAYYVESSGAVVELYTDLEQIYDDDRAPVVWAEGENWWNLWSASRPADFRAFGIRPAAL